MRAIIFYCNANVADKLEAIVSAASINIKRIEPATRSSSHGDFFEISDEDYSIKLSLSRETFEFQSRMWQCRIVVYAPRRLLSIIRDKDPGLTLAKRVRSALESQPFGTVVTDNLTDETKRDGGNGEIKVDGRNQR